MRISVLAIACSINCGVFAGLLSGQPGQTLKGSIAAGCVSAEGVRVKAVGGGNIYNATIRKGQFVFVRPQVLNGNAPYTVFIEPIQKFQFEPGKLVGPVSVYTPTTVAPQPCTKVIARRSERYFHFSYLIASTGSSLPFFSDPDDSVPPPATPATGRQFSFKVRSAAAPPVPSPFKILLNRASATIFAIDQQRSVPVARVAAAPDGSLSVFPARYASGQSFLVSFEKSGFDPEVRAVASLAELASTTISLQQTDMDAHPPKLTINQNDPRRGRSSLVNEIDHLPIAGRRSVDSLALLNPGVVPAPKAGTGYGPGIGPTIGSAGEVAVNGLRPRMNNFVTDGADNNDEAVGVRRQGFVFPGPYVLESIREFQTLTGLYDTGFGRASAGQFNVLTRVGTQVLHGSLYGYLSDARISARDYFNADYSRGGPGSIYYLGTVKQTDQYSGSAKDPRTNGTAGILLETPVGVNTHISLNAEWRGTRARQTSHFSVPTVAERGFLGTGGTGFSYTDYQIDSYGERRQYYPSSAQGDAVFSLFPFPNSPTGPYGANTFTEVLPADERGLLYSFKLDRSFQSSGWKHHLAGVFSGSTETSTLPVTGGALFSMLNPNVHTFSGTTFLDTNIGTNSANGLRFAVGQANFSFERVQDPRLLPSNWGDPYLLNQTMLLNRSNPSLGSYSDHATYSAATNANIPRTIDGCSTGPGGKPISVTNTECLTGPVGEINVAGYSGLGTDVFRFPQVRRDRTIQLSDSFTHFHRGWTFIGGVDYWHFRYDSIINPNAAPYLQYNGQVNGPQRPIPELPLRAYNLVSPADLVAMSLPALDLQTLTTSRNHELILSRNQVDLFVNVSGKITSRLSLTVGVRAEFNRLPTSRDGRFESAFNQGRFNQQLQDGRTYCSTLADDPSVNYDAVNLLRTECNQRVDLLSQAFVGNYDSIFSANRLTFDPRVGLAWTPTSDGKTVIRAGFGKYTSQFPAVLLDESRSVFPLSYTLNFETPVSAYSDTPSNFYLVQSQIATAVSSPNNSLSTSGLDPVAYFTRAANFSALTILNQRPADHLLNSYAFHYGLTLERAISSLGIASVAYVATTAHHLLRRLSPDQPGFNYGRAYPPLVTRDFWTAPWGNNPTPVFLQFQQRTACQYRTTDPEYPYADFPCAQVANQLLETGGSSFYQSLQTELRGHFRRARAQYGSAFTWGHSIDDASDFFDTRSGYALPQASLNAGSNRASSDFDVRLRWVSYFDWQPIAAGSRGPLTNVLAGGWRLSGIYTMQSGMPFTANSVYDSNGDGLLNDGLASAYGLNVNSGDRRTSLSFLPGFQAGQFVPKSVSSFGFAVGAVGRNAFRGPGLNTLDLSVGRSFSLGDRQLTVRLEGFNVANHPQFGMPVRLLGAPGFGTSVDTAATNRRLQVNVQFSF